MTMETIGKFIRNVKWFLLALCIVNFSCVIIKYWSNFTFTIVAASGWFLTFVYVAMTMSQDKVIEEWEKHSKFQFKMFMEASNTVKSLQTMIYDLDNEITLMKEEKSTQPSQNRLTN